MSTGEITEVEEVQYRKTIILLKGAFHQYACKLTTQEPAYYLVFPYWDAERCGEEVTPETLAKELETRLQFTRLCSSTSCCTEKKEGNQQ